MWKRDQQEKARTDTRQAPGQPAASPTSANPPSIEVSSTVSPPLTTPQPRALPGRSLVIKGDISSDEDLVLHGRVHGNVSLPGHVLTIGPQAELSAEITARGLIVEGNLNGNVAATERFEIRPGGRMKGDVTCPNVIMSEGAEFTGRVDMRRRFGKNEGAPAEGDRRSSA
jgi:cytoskeletal protein CcmA (bactofilin family)